MQTSELIRQAQVIMLDYNKDYIQWRLRQIRGANLRNTYEPIKPSLQKFLCEFNISKENIDSETLLQLKNIFYYL